MGRSKEDRHIGDSLFPTAINMLVKISAVVTFLMLVVLAPTSSASPTPNKVSPQVLPKISRVGH